MFTWSVCEGQTKSHVVISVCFTRIITQGSLKKDDYPENQKEKFLTLDGEKKKTTKLLVPMPFLKQMSCLSVSGTTTLGLETIFMTGLNSKQI